LMDMTVPFVNDGRAVRTARSGQASPGGFG
jgi:hypothetical protein